MSKGNKKQNIPKPSELLGKSTPEEETPDEAQVVAEAKEKTPEPKEAPSLEDIVNNLPEEM